MKFSILVADCPWSYNRKSTGGTNKSGSSQHYNIMTNYDLAQLYQYIIPIMNKDSVLFLWTTVPMLEDALDVMEYWGFEYKTMITWVKKNNGLGNYFRGKTEHLLMGVRGKVKPFRLQAPNLIISEKTLKHSEKPIESYRLIDKCAEQMDHSLHKPINVLELFARDVFVSDNINWTCIGKDISGNDIKKDLENCLEQD